MSSWRPDGSSPWPATLRRILDDPELLAGVLDIADVLREAIGPHAGQRLADPYPDEIHDAVVEARLRLDRVAAALTAIQTPVEDAKQRKLRAQLLTGRADRAPRPGARPR